jgi:hypothetical protein
MAEPFASIISGAAALAFVVVCLFVLYDTQPRRRL